MAGAAGLRGGLGRLLALTVVLACTPDLARAAPGDDELVSVEHTAAAAAGGSAGRVATSADGRYVLFGSTASTVVPGDTNGVQDVFLRDRATGIVERVSLGFGGMEANGPSWPGSISADGRYVTFESSASNLVSGDDPDGHYETFLLDRQSGIRVRAPARLVSTHYWPHWSSVSNSGEYVAGVVGNNVYLWRFVWDGQLTTFRWISEGYYPSISGNGRYVIFGSYRADLVPGDVPGTFDLFRYDRVTREYRRVGRNIYAQSASAASISRDGRFVAFIGEDPHGPGDVEWNRQAYLWDAATGSTRIVSATATGAPGNQPTDAVSVSDDGRHVAFTSHATNLAPGESGSATDLDLFVKDMQTQAVERVTRDPWERSYTPELALSDDGRFVAFNSSLALLPLDTNSSMDIYVHETGGSPVEPGAFDYHLRPRALDFGEVKVGAELRKGFTLANAGTVSLPITTVALAGVDRSQYVLRSYCGSQLEIGGRCWIAVTFKPTAVGVEEARLRVVAGGITRNRALRGTAVP